jgi:oxygen-independent coproporphyrinogen-3 oxidase
MTPEYSLYLHIPFCRHRCAYCDFNTYAGQEAVIPAYVDALCREIEFVGSQLPSPPGRGAGSEAVHTIFFGGGTPSLLSTRQFDAILHSIRCHFDLSTPEITVEANPGTCSLAYLQELRSLGINRISFGVQSIHPSELRQLERIHDFYDVIESVNWARQVSFDNLNLDLIFGLPEQSLDRWRATVKQAVSLRPEHLSLYALTIEPGTPFGRWAARGRMPTPDPDLAAEMYEWAGDFLESQGYIQYEISNWARTEDENGGPKAEENVHPSSFILSPSYACLHNLTYWRNQPYLGFGAGAHGYAAGVRYSNVLRIKTYIGRMAEIRNSEIENRASSLAFSFPNLQSRISNLEFPLSPATTSQHKINQREEMQETMITGLRLTLEGVSADVFHDRFGEELQGVFGKEIDELVTLGLLEWVCDETSEVLHLTPRGRLLGNQVFMRFVE